MRLQALFILILLATAVLAVTARPDFYELLGLPHGADEKKVKQAYKKLVRTLHPDLVPEAEREATRDKFRAVTEAYEVLSDPLRRAQYENGRQTESTPQDRQYLRFNLFSQDFDGVQLRDTAMQKLQAGQDPDTYFVFFWSSNFPDCIDEAPAFKLLATKLKGTSVNVASFRCDDDPAVCRRIGLPTLPLLKMFHRGRMTDYTGRVEIAALVHFAARFVNTTAKLIASSADAVLHTCPNPFPSLASYGTGGNFLWMTTKRSHRGVLDFGLVALQYSPCTDCETALHLALETVSDVMPQFPVRRVDCRRPSNAELCDGRRVKDRAWTLTVMRHRCWYATKKPYTFSDEVCEPLTVVLFEERYNNEQVVNFVVAQSRLKGAKSLREPHLEKLKKGNDAWAIMYDDGDPTNATHRVQWNLLGQSVNSINPIRNRKGYSLHIGRVNCRMNPKHCNPNIPRPYVLLYGYGTKVKATEPVLYRKIGGWKAMLKDISRDAEPLHLHVLTAANYNTKIRQGHDKGRTWFVLFNAGQWCPPCNQIRGPWNDATRQVQNSPQRKRLSFGIVECDKDKQLCNSLGIGSYPLMAYLAKDRPRAEYSGARDGHEIAKWAIDQLDNRLQTLHPADLSSRIQRGDAVLVAFTAGAWCPPCTQLAPVLKKASNLVPKATTVSFNCDENPSFCNSFGIEGYPTVLLFTKGQRHQFEAYRKDEHQLAAWANQLLHL